MISYTPTQTNDHLHAITCALPRTSLAPTDEALRYGTLVARWSQVNFDRPVPLVDRRDLKAGDRVFSSFGYAAEITHTDKTFDPSRSHSNGEPAVNPSVHLWFDNGRAELFSGPMPLLARDGIVYGNIAR